MKNISSFIFTLIGSAVFSQIAFCLETEKVPTLCKQEEFPYLNAKMAKVVNQKESGYHLENNGKILSICVDKDKEPFGKLIYRYGVIGQVEMEREATSKKKFYIYDMATSPHTGRNIFWFKSGAYTYIVTEATAQGSGIGLKVFKSGIKVVDLFSGNDRGSDYESGLIDINFSIENSPIFIVKKPEGIF